MYSTTKGKLLLTFDSATRDYETISSGHKIYNPTVGSRVEVWATVIGEVLSVCYESELGLKRGDTVAVSHLIVSKKKVTKQNTVIFFNKYRIPDKGGDIDAWIADEELIYAKKVGDEWEAVGDWVMMKEIKAIANNPLIFSGGELTKEEKRMFGGLLDESKVFGKAMFISGDIDAKKGDEVYFDEVYRSEYEIGRNIYIFLTKDRIVGKKKSIKL